MTEREKQLEAILRDLVPGTINILWCALVWNDHNFTYQDLLARAQKAAKALGYERRNGVDAVNAWMERVEKVLGEESSSNGSEQP
jgi:hypothetical protein